MKFNYNKEKMKFDKKWESLYKEYLDSGMSRENILKIYEFDWMEFKQNRNFYNNNMVFSDCKITEEKNVLYSNISKKLSINDEYFINNKYRWIDELSIGMVQAINVLDNEDIKLLQMYAIEGKSQMEISKKYNISQASISKRINRIRKIIKKSMKTIS